jgi:hypothetical protein
MEENEAIVIKISGEQDLVELVVSQLKKLYKMSVAGPIRQNDQNNGVHVFVTINPLLANKVMEK